MLEQQIPVLKGKTITLRRPQLEDAAARLKLGRHAEIVRMYGGDSVDVPPMTLAGAENWVRALIEHDHAWIIETDVLIGQIRLDKLDLQDRRATLSVGIENPQDLNKGIGTEAIKLVLKYAFTELKLHRISLRVLTFNHRAIRAYEKCGFKIEGRERESAFIDNEWQDDLMMGILNREFSAN